jgi:hypothetical protein
MTFQHLVLAASLGVLAPIAHAAEGMWLFNQPPTRQLQEEHGFRIPDGWLEHLQQASVRLGSGGSGSFVSKDGLVLTNHHVGSGTIQKLSTRERDLLKDGFLAPTRSDELPCPDLELNVLQSITDVTTEVNAAVRPDQDAEEAYEARRRAIAGIQKRSLDETGLRSDVVTLHRGGAYHLYCYKRYTDVRLVFAPDQQAAFFGGDPDNFSYPRYCYDLCFFRAYEDGEPARTPHFLKWNAQGPAEGELIFVSGHPGHTNRSNTVAELESTRDFGLPYGLQRAYRTEVAIAAWARRDLENNRRAKGLLFGIQNGRKARRAALEGLLDPEFMRRKLHAESEFRMKLRGGPEGAEADRAFDRIAQATKDYQKEFPHYHLFEGGDAFNSTLFGIARTLLRAASETPKPNGERLEEFQDARRPSLELRLFSPKPIYRDLEEVKLADSLTFLHAMLGSSDSFVQEIMAGKSPQARARELVQGTGLQDPALRRSLYDGGEQAIAKSTDPMIALARLVDGPSREIRRRVRPLDEIAKQSHRAIAQARHDLEGDTLYPDATFTLRLSYGIASGYREGEREIPFQTTIGGLYQRSETQQGQPPFHLPSPWSAHKADLDLGTPFNFVSTLDITGGNSGSPVVNRDGELVGLIFDSNLQGLVLDYGYSEESARAVSVHTGGMLEGLRKVYRAGALVDELTGPAQSRDTPTR